MTTTAMEGKGGRGRKSGDGDGDGKRPLRAKYWGEKDGRQSAVGKSEEAAKGKIQMVQTLRLKTYGL